MPLARRLGTHVLGVLTAWVTGLSIGDSQCGYTAISAEALRAIDLNTLWTGYGYPNDFLAALARARLPVTEVSVRPIYRGEASGLRPHHVAVIALLLLRATTRRARGVDS